MGQLEDLQVFIRVVEAGGIGRAAEQLNIAKSAVSRRLSELESRLNTKLIQRTTRRFHLTEEGKRYFEKAHQVVNAFEELDGSVLDQSEVLKGRLTVSIPLSFGILEMYKVFDAFKHKYPDISLNIDLSDREVDMITQGVDVAFRIGELNDSSIQARKIMPVEIKICASPNYLDKFSDVVTLDDIEEMAWLRYNSDKASGIRVSTPDGEDINLQVKGDIQSNNGDFLMQLAIAGRGLVVLPSFICGESIEKGDLVQILPDHHIEPIYAYAVYPQNRYLSRNARAFIDFLVEFYKH